MRRKLVHALALAVIGITANGCGWQGLNSLPLPGVEGAGPDGYTIQAELPDLDNLKQNSRVRVGDVTVGSVSKIERRGWHALVTMRLNGDVVLPANSTAVVGQTSLLGSQHVELAAPVGSPPQGRLTQGSVIGLHPELTYPTTEQTLATMSLLLNGGGLGQLQDITTAFSTAGAGHEEELKNLLSEVDEFTANIDHQTTVIIAAMTSLDGVTGQLAAQEPVLDRAMRTIPQALAVLKDQRGNLAKTLGTIGKLGALATTSIDQTKQAIVHELQAFAAVLRALGNAGPAMTRSLETLLTFPWPKSTIDKFVRGDYANMTLVVDLTLSRLDNAFLTGTRWEGSLTELEMQWGRTIGQLPSPYTGANPLLAPYHLDQGK